MDQDEPDTYRSTYKEENEQNIHQYMERNLSTLNSISDNRNQPLIFLFKFLVKDKYE
jgi:hypothetical protein